MPDGSEYALPTRRVLTVPVARPVRPDGLSVLRERIRAARVPRARRGQSVVIATWNIRELGKTPRRPESLRYMAEILRTFDLCAVIELRENLTDFHAVLRHLGPSFRAVYSECVRDAGGNRERIAFVYDTRMIEFTGMASHLHPPREKDGHEYLSKVAWWRPPYVASFRTTGRPVRDFVLAAAHIRWGAGGIGPRATEIALLADWALKYAASRHTIVRDVLLIGDFNIPSVRSEAFRVLEQRKIAVPAALAGVFGTVTADDVGSHAQRFQRDPGDHFGAVGWTSAPRRGLEVGRGPPERVPSLLTRRGRGRWRGRCSVSV